MSKSSPANPRKLSSDWVSSGAMCRELGFSAKHLLKLRGEKLLAEGTHWVNISPNAGRPTYRYHIKRCKIVLGVKL